MWGAWVSHSYITIPAVPMYRMVHVDRMDILLIILVKQLFLFLFLFLKIDQRGSDGYGGLES